MIYALARSGSTHLYGEVLKKITTFASPHSQCPTAIVSRILGRQGYRQAVAARKDARGDGIGAWDHQWCRQWVHKKIRYLAHLAEKKVKVEMSPIRSNSQTPTICRIETGLKARQPYVARSNGARARVAVAGEEKEEKSMAAAVAITVATTSFVIPSRQPSPWP